MALQFHPLPVDLFDERLRPAIGRFNRELRDVFGLESIIRNERGVARSDASVVRGEAIQVHATRITPSVVTGMTTAAVADASYLVLSNHADLTAERRTVVSSPLTATDAGANSTYTLGWSGTLAASALGATPTIGFSSGYAQGSATTFVRSDATLVFPQALRSTANATTLTLTDDGTDQTLAYSLGISKLQAVNGFEFSATSGSVVLDFDASWTIGHATGINANVVAAGNPVVTGNKTVFLSSMTSIGASFNGTNVSQFRTLAFSLTPAAGSSTTNKAYGGWFLGPLINNANGGWSEVAALNLEAPRRLAANPSVDLAATIVAETPTISGSTQIGLYLKQRASAQHVATNRYGIFIDSQNSGTARYSIYGVSDLAKFTGPLDVDGALGVTGLATFGNSVTVLSGNVVTGGLQCDSIINDTGLAGGTYSPTVSNEANAGSSTTATVAQYLRVGNTVIVSGRFTADPLLTATATSFELSLPVASNIGASEDAAGTAFCGAIAGQGASIRGSTANDTAVVEWVAGDVTSQTWSYSYGYRVI